jgi:carbon-monoxide dehydrogenase medium subunit
MALMDLSLPGAMAVGGGTQVSLMLRHRLVETSRLVWLGRVAGLSDVSIGPDDALVVGGGVTVARIARSREVRDRHPMLAEAASQVGNPRIRAVATLGGHLVHADPRQDLPPCLLVMRAVAVIASAAGERRVAMRDFFRGFLETVVGEDELLVRVEIPPARPATRSRYVRFTPGSSDDYPTVGVAASLELEDGRVRGATLALGGVASTAFLIDCSAMVGRPPGSAAVADVAETAAASSEPVTDQRGSAAYKRAMARLWTRRLLDSLTQLPGRAGTLSEDSART